MSEDAQQVDAYVVCQGFANRGTRLLLREICDVAPSFPIPQPPRGVQAAARGGHRRRGSRRRLLLLCLGRIRCCSRKEFTGLLRQFGARVGGRGRSVGVQGGADCTRSGSGNLRCRSGGCCGAGSVAPASVACAPLSRTASRKATATQAQPFVCTWTTVYSWP